MDKSKFPDGINFQRPREGAPDFVKGRMGIHVQRLVDWLRDNAGGDEWINFQLLQSKDGEKLYFQVDTYGKKTPVVKKEEPKDDMGFDQYPENTLDEPPF